MAPSRLTWLCMTSLAVTAPAALGRHAVSNTPLEPHRMASRRQGPLRAFRRRSSDRRRLDPRPTGGVAATSLGRRHRSTLGGDVARRSRGCWLLRGRPRREVGSPTRRRITAMLRTRRPTFSRFPPSDTAWDDTKQRVGQRKHYRIEAGRPLRIACSELPPQVSPLMLELPTRNGHPGCRTPRTDEVAVERVAAPLSLFVHNSKVLRDGAGGRRLAAETGKLRMMTVAACRISQDRLSQ